MVGGGLRNWVTWNMFFGTHISKENLHVQSFHWRLLAWFTALGAGSQVTKRFCCPRLQNLRLWILLVVFVVRLEKCCSYCCLLPLHKRLELLGSQEFARMTGTRHFGYYIPQAVQTYYDYYAQLKFQLTFSSLAPWSATTIWIVKLELDCWIDGTWASWSHLQGLACKWPFWSLAGSRLQCSTRARIVQHSYKCTVHCWWPPEIVLTAVLGQREFAFSALWGSEPCTRTTRSAPKHKILAHWHGGRQTQATT